MCRFDFPIDMSNFNERGERMIIKLHGLTCRLRREVKMAYMCASALGFMQSIDLGGFRGWWDYHTQEQENRTECKRHAIVFVATLNDRHDSLSFIPVTLGEMRVLFQPSQVLEVLELWKKISVKKDKKERSILALALRDRESYPMGRTRYRILPMLLPQSTLAGGQHTRAT